MSLKFYVLVYPFLPFLTRWVKFFVIFLITTLVKLLHENSSQFLFNLINNKNLQLKNIFDILVIGERESSYATSGF